MRRIRQVPQGVSQEAFARLTVAMALSAALHVYLIYGLALQQAEQSHLSIINARLVPESAAKKPRKALAASATQGKDIRPAPPQVVPLPEPDERTEPVVQTPSTENPGDDTEFAALGLPDPIHYPVKDLDVYPQLLNRLEPDYPPIALAAGIAGSVTLLILIDEFGRVTDASVVEASPPDMFEESARRAVAANAYAPAQKNGHPVRSRILVKVDYDPAANTLER
ncbi:MAG TPA: TonB family protein [Burkholderiales bacterium]|nr:TonB family protein [Burkholderiales bacterium]